MLLISRSAPGGSHEVVQARALNVPWFTARAQMTPHTEHEYSYPQPLFQYLALTE
jgi:hypothetical protein